MLKENIKNALDESLKSGDRLKRSVLAMVMTSIKNKELAKRDRLSKSLTDTAALEKESQLNDEEVMEVLSSEVKKRKEAIEQFKNGGREELAEKEKSELDILMPYLPSQLSEEEIKSEVEKAIAEVKPEGLKDMGKVMAIVMSKTKGRADSGLVSGFVKDMLQK